MGFWGVTVSSSAFGCKFSSYIWAKLRNVACRPHLSVWVITETGQASNHHSSIPTPVSKQRKTHMNTTVRFLFWSPTQNLGHCTASCYYMTEQKPRNLSNHKCSVSRPNIYFFLLFAVLWWQPSCVKASKGQIIALLIRAFTASNAVGFWLSV